MSKYLFCLSFVFYFNYVYAYHVLHIIFLFLRPSIIILPMVNVHWYIYYVKEHNYILLFLQLIQNLHLNRSTGAIGQNHVGKMNTVE